LLTVGLVLEDPAAPRTVFYDRLVDAIRRDRRFRGAGARLVIPAEDTAEETNWPRYGNRESAYVRGARHDLSEGGAFARYLNDIGAYAAAHPQQAVLVVSMHPFVRLPNVFRGRGNVLVADGSLAAFERALNPRTISMPALPMVRPAPGGARERDILASFQGAPSHPVRQALAALAGEPGFVVRLVEPRQHMGRIDAENGMTDAAYEALLDRSLFSFVPRGDALFSYRLLEVMARGSIPVILSDGWVLPFDRLLDWDAIALRVHQDAVAQIPAILGSLRRDEIERRQACVRRAYAERLSGLGVIVEAMLAEAERLLEGA
jgi:hypothetical protein